MCVNFQGPQQDVSKGRLPIAFIDQLVDTKLGQEMLSIMDV